MLVVSYGNQYSCISEFEQNAGKKLALQLEKVNKCYIFNCVYFTKKIYQFLKQKYVVNPFLRLEEQINKS